MLKLHEVRHFQRLVQNLKDTTSVSVGAEGSSVLLISGPVQFTADLEVMPSADDNFEDTLMEVLQERRKAMYPELQVRYVFSAVDDALNPHYEGLVRHYAGRIRDFEGKCVTGERQHKAWIKERHQLGQEVEELQKKVQEERERANQFSTVAANNSLRLMTGKSIPKGQLNAIKMVGAGGLDVNVQNLEKDIGKLDIDVGTTRFKTLQSIINSIYWRFLPQTRDIKYIASHYGEACGAFFRFHSTLLLISVITLVSYSPLLVMQLVDYWSQLGQNWCGSSHLVAMAGDRFCISVDARRPAVFLPQTAPGRPPCPPQRAADSAGFVGVIWTSAAASLALESRTTVGKRVTSPLLSFFLGWMLRSLRLLPPLHPVYDSLASRLLPAALPLMVLSAQIRPQGSVSRDRHDLFLMLLTFSVCSFASCGGALAAFMLGRAWLDVPRSVVSKVCGCLTATYIGGSANLAEVAFDSGLAKEGAGILACLAAADVLLMCFYFAGLMLVANAYKLSKQRATAKDNQTAHFPGRQQCGGGWTLYSYNLCGVPGMDRVGRASCCVWHSRLCTWNASCICIDEAFLLLHMTASVLLSLSTGPCTAFSPEPPQSSLQGLSDRRSVRRVNPEAHMQSSYAQRSGRSIIDVEVLNGH
eukprot:s1477_g2.t3